MYRNLGEGNDFVADVLARAAQVGKCLLVLLAMISAAALLYYVWKGYIPEFHSDSATKNLLAEEVVRSGSYFPPDWHYVNGDLWVFFTHLFMIPLLLFFRNGYELHAFAGTISSIIVLASVWCVSGMVVKSKWIRFLVLTILAGGVSSLMAENLFGQTSYGNVLYLAAFSLYFGWRWLEASDLRARVAWGTAFVALNVLTFWGNPQRAAAYDAAPMFAAIAAWAFTHGELLVWKPGARHWQPSATLWRAVQLAFLLVIGALIGSLLHAYFIANVNNVEGANSTKWLLFSGFLDNAGKTLEGMIAIFGGLPPADQRVISTSGIYYGLRFIFVCALLIIMPVACVHFMRSLTASARMFAGFTVASLCLFVFVQVTTTTPDMTSPVISARYMLPALVFGLVLVAAYAEWATIRSPTGLLSWAVLLVLLSSLISPLNPFSRMYRAYGPDMRPALIAELKKHGLKYGYATYWNSGALSVLSEGDVLVRQVKIERDLPVPFRHLGSSRWFRPDEWKGETFIMLTHQEAAEVDWPAVYSYAGRPKQEFELGGFQIKVFPTNLASKMPGWDDRVELLTDMSMGINKHSLHNVGAVAVIADGRNAIVAELGQSGFLHYGPYLDIPAGSYQVEFDVIALGSSREFGYVDVTAGSGLQVLAQAKIESGQQGPLTLAFSSSEPMKGVELRVFSNGASKMTLRRIGIRPSHSAPLTTDQ